MEGQDLIKPPYIVTPEGLRVTPNGIVLPDNISDEYWDNLQRTKMKKPGYHTMYINNRYPVKTIRGNPVRRSYTMERKVKLALLRLVRALGPKRFADIVGAKTAYEILVWAGYQKTKTWTKKKKKRLREFCQVRKEQPEKKLTELAKEFRISLSTASRWNKECSSCC